MNTGYYHVMNETATETTFFLSQKNFVNFNQNCFLRKQLRMADSVFDLTMTTNVEVLEEKLEEKEESFGMNKFCPFI